MYLRAAVTLTVTSDAAGSADAAFLPAAWLQPVCPPRCPPAPPALWRNHLSCISLRGTDAQGPETTPARGPGLCLLLEGEACLCRSAGSLHCVPIGPGPLARQSPRHGHAVFLQRASKHVPLNPESCQWLPVQVPTQQRVLIDRPCEVCPFLTVPAPFFTLPACHPMISRSLVLKIPHGFTGLLAFAHTLPPPSTTFS